MSYMNWFRTTLLMAAMAGLLIAAGYLIAGPNGALIALVLAAFGNLFAYWNSDKMLLRMNHAREVSRSDAPELYDTVEKLAQRAGLPMPKVYIIENDQPNAFATGRNPDNAAVAITTGLMRILDGNEAAGVLAHELAHIRNRDTLIMTITATIAGAISNLGLIMLFTGGGRNNPLGIVGVLLMIILAPLAAMLVQMAISRTREYGADAGGAEICGNPNWLASALMKLDRDAKRIANDTAEKHPATAHLYIVNPLHKQKIDGLFATHPRIEDRVERLRAMPGGSPWL